MSYESYNKSTKRAFIEEEGDFENTITNKRRTCLTNEKHIDDYIEEFSVFHSPNRSSDTDQELKPTTLLDEHSIEVYVNAKIDSEEDSSDDYQSDPADLHFHVCTQSSDTTPSSLGNKNVHVTDILEKVEKTYLAQGMKWNALGIRKAIAALKQHPKEIKSGKEAKRLQGIGESIAEKIDQIIRTGGLDTVTNDQMNQVMYLFNNIWGVGSKTAMKWYARGLRTLDDLNKHLNELNPQQQVGLKYYADFKLKIPRNEVTEHGEFVNRVVKSIDSGLNITIGGSYRRGRKECGDIDMVITHTNNNKPIGVLHQIVAKLKKLGYLTDDLEISDPFLQRDWDHHFDKYMGVAKLGECPHRRIDLIMVPTKSYPVTMIYFTGSEYFNRSMRHFARQTGFYVCNHAIAKADSRGKRIEGTIFNVTCEKDVFDLLKMEYKEPHERDW